MLFFMSLFTVPREIQAFVPHSDDEETEAPAQGSWWEGRESRAPVLGVSI
jgi:hypothetical protein